MFDRIEKDVFLDYSEAGWAKAMSLGSRIDFDKSILDVDAAIDWLRNETEGNVGIVGYCYGGTMAWLTSCRLKVEAAVGYYGGAIVNFLSEEPQNPIMLHFGGEDMHITPETIAKIQFAHPEVPIFVYNDAGHAFNRSADPKAFVAEASRQAKQRSLLFFEQHLVF
jgi:carboxymethylenebutenolidase